MALPTTRRENKSITPGYLGWPGQNAAAKNPATPRALSPVDDNGGPPADDFAGRIPALAGEPASAQPVCPHWSASGSGSGCRWPPGFGYTIHGSGCAAADVLYRQDVPANRNRRCVTP